MREFLVGVLITAAVTGAILGIVGLIGLSQNNEFERQSDTTKIPGSSCYILEEYEYDDWDGDTRNYSKKVVCDK